MTNFFNKFISEKESINNNKDKYTFLLKFLLIACSFSKDQIIVRVLKNKLNKEFELKLLSLAESSLLKLF